MTRGGNGFLRLLPHQARDAFGKWLSLSLLAVALTYLLLHSGVHTGPYVGAAVAVGMVTHILGDAITPTAVPLAWPVQVKGRRWAILGAPKRYRIRAGAWQEKVIGVFSGAGTVVLYFVLLAG